MRRGYLVTAVVDVTLIALGVGYLAAGPAHEIWGDGWERYVALTEVLEHGRIPGGDYSLVGPLGAAPLWLAGKLSGAPVRWVASYNLVLFTIALVMIYVLLRDRIDRKLLRRFLLLLVAGSMIAAPATNFYGEVFTALLVGVGLLAATMRYRAGWAAVVLGAVNTPASLLGLGLVSAAEAVRWRRLRYAVPVLAGALLVLAEITLRHGGYVGNRGETTLMPYSGRPGFSYPLILGLVAILFSFGRGLVWFQPGLVLPVRRRLRRLDPDLARVYELWLLFLAGLVVVYAGWWAWYGGMSWGPRFFLVGILPASLALAVRLGDPRASVPQDLATLAALVLSAWVAADAALFATLWPPQCFGEARVLESLCHFTPEFSPLWYPFVAKPQLSGEQLAGAAYYAAACAWLAAPVLKRLATRISRPRSVAHTPALSTD